MPILKAKHTHNTQIRSSRVHTPTSQPAKTPAFRRCAREKGSSSGAEGDDGVVGGGEGEEGPLMGLGYPEPVQRTRKSYGMRRRRAGVEEEEEEEGPCGATMTCMRGGNVDWEGVGSSSHSHTHPVVLRA